MYCRKNHDCDLDLQDTARDMRDLCIVCGGCLLDDASPGFTTTAAAIEHVEAHVAAGHMVPATLIPFLRAEDAAVAAGRAWADRVVERRPVAPLGDAWPFEPHDALGLLTSNPSICCCGKPSAHPSGWCGEPHRQPGPPLRGVCHDLAEVCNAAAAERWEEHVKGTAVVVHRQIRYLKIGHWEDLTGQTRGQIEHVLREWTGVPLRISISVYPAARDADGLPSQEPLFDSGLIAVKSLAADTDPAGEWAQQRILDCGRVLAALDLADKAERAPIAETQAAFATFARARGAYLSAATGLRGEAVLAPLRAARDEAEARYHEVIGAGAFARGERS